MLLSEAILLGSTLKPQCYRKIFDGVGTCAWGAAYDAVGILGSPNSINFAANFNLGLIKSVSSCPIYSCSRKDNINILIAHLNDAHHLTREQIASWVAEKERELNFTDKTQNIETSFLIEESNNSKAELTNK